ncbi:hypothetical protein [Pedobacter sp. MR2016-24]|uniref:hypothetical protein n=1 Tax=Pedobacter sp. MR2016-24 TaxID=2994466 RepID=UPI00224707A4|nr:hypothetical protein [Pedobacter sp. MR2016-24]
MTIRTSNRSKMPGKYVEENSCIVKMGQIPERQLMPDPHVIFELFSRFSAGVFPDIAFRQSSFFQHTASMINLLATNGEFNGKRGNDNV